MLVEPFFTNLQARFGTVKLKEIFMVKFNVFVSVLSEREIKILCRPSESCWSSVSQFILYPILCVYIFFK